MPGEPLDDEVRAVLAPSLAALAAPGEASAIAGGAGELQGAFVALRELAGTAPLRVPRSEPFEVFGGDAPELELARRELSAHALSADPRLLRAGVLTAHCAALLQLRWFAEHGGLAWRREQGRGQLAADAGSFARTPRSLLELLNRLGARAGGGCPGGGVTDLDAEVLGDWAGTAR